MYRQHREEAVKHQRSSPEPQMEEMFQDLNLKQKIRKFIYYTTTNAKKSEDTQTNENLMVLWFLRNQPEIQISRNKR